MAMVTGEKAVLVVSFGTSVSEARERTINRIEEEIASSFSDCRIYCAWTSRVLIEKLFRRDGIRIPTVEEAVRQMLSDGIRYVIIQPTHLINGIEYERMKAQIQAYGRDFAAVSFGDPLLATAEDQKQAIRAVMEEFRDLAEDEALVFMGHGTVHEANAVYAALGGLLDAMGYRNVFMGTIGERPAVDALLERLGQLGLKRVVLAPFMVVAGNHALHDMSGAAENSWKSRFEAAGFQTVCVLRGLGEYAGIRRRYVAHAKEAERRLESRKDTWS